MPQILGITLGFGVMTIAAGLGLAGLFQAEPGLHALLKYVGGAYLVYLAWCIARAAPASTDARRAKPIGDFAATLFTWMNPKGWVTTIGALSAFTTVEGNLLQQTAMIAIVLAVACFASLVLWAGFGAAIARFLTKPRARLAFNGAMAGLLVLSLVPVFW